MKELAAALSEDNALERIRRHVRILVDIGRLAVKRRI
jgi:hypothetical protein